jgi:ABC-2 type transport system ATP-binding protein
VVDVAVEGRTLRCGVRGPMAPLLHALTEAGVDRIVTHEPSLEELFLHRYGDERSGSKAAGSAA